MTRRAESRPRVGPGGGGGRMVLIAIGVEPGVVLGMDKAAHFLGRSTGPDWDVQWSLELPRTGLCRSEFLPSEEEALECLEEAWERLEAGESKTILSWTWNPVIYEMCPLETWRGMVSKWKGKAYEV